MYENKRDRTLECNFTILFLKRPQYTVVLFDQNRSGRDC